MKLTACLLLFILSSFCASAQKDTLKKKQLGVVASITSNQIADMLPNASAVFSTGKHSLFAGSFLVNSIDPAQKGPFFAWQAGYRIYPNGKTNRMNLFLETEFNFFRSKIVQTTAAPSSNPNGGVKKQTIINNVYAQYLAAGFRLNILENLHINVTAGIGFDISKYSFTYEYWNGVIVETGSGSTYFGHPTGNYGNGVVRIGVGYDFLTLKKKG